MRNSSAGWLASGKRTIITFRAEQDKDICHAAQRYHHELPEAVRSRFFVQCLPAHGFWHDMEKFEGIKPLRICKGSRLWCPQCGTSFLVEPRE